jgi:hypothetical protein
MKANLWHLDTRGVREEFVKGYINVLEAHRMLVECGFSVSEAEQHITDLRATIQRDMLDEMG